MTGSCTRVPLPLWRWFNPMLLQDIGHGPSYAGRTHRHDVGVQHHEREPAVALQLVLQMEIDDGLLLPVLQPKVPGNPTVVLVDAV